MASERRIDTSDMLRQLGRKYALSPNFILIWGIIENETATTRRPTSGQWGTRPTQMSVFYPSLIIFVIGQSPKSKIDAKRR